MRAFGRNQIRMVSSRFELNVEYRTPNFEFRSAMTPGVSFDIHYSLFDILRFETLGNRLQDFSEACGEVFA